MGDAALWTLGGSALISIGLGVTCAILGIQLGRVRADLAGAEAEISRAQGLTAKTAEERDRALSQLADERTRAAQQVGELRRQVAEYAQFAAQNAPPDVLREKLRDLLTKG